MEVTTISGHKYSGHFLALSVLAFDWPNDFLEQKFLLLSSYVKHSFNSPHRCSDLSREIMKVKAALRVCTYVALLASSSVVHSQNCKKPLTQSDMNVCASKGLDEETNKMNKTYDEYIQKLNVKEKQQFKEVQLAWKKYKDLSCDFESLGVEGGSVRPMIVALCLDGMTRQRHESIKFMNECKQGNLSCPAR